VKLSMLYETGACCFGRSMRLLSPVSRTSFAVSRIQFVRAIIAQDGN